MSSRRPASHTQCELLVGAWHQLEDCPAGQTVQEGLLALAGLCSTGAPIQSQRRGAGERGNSRAGQDGCPWRGNRDHPILGHLMA